MSGRRQLGHACPKGAQQATCLATAFSLIREKARASVTDHESIQQKVTGSTEVVLSGRGPHGSLEEADTYIQAGSCQTHEHDHAQTTNHSHRMQNVARFRLGNGLRRNF
jgi:hypothetical protein